MERERCPECGQEHTDTITHIKSGKTYRRCQAHSKSRVLGQREDGSLIYEQCYGQAINKKRTCKNHNGKALRGYDSKSLRTGRYSKWLSEQWVEPVADALANPGLLSLVDNVALADGRLAEVLLRLADAPTILAEVRTQLQVFKSHRDKDTRRIALETLLGIIEKGPNYDRTMHEFVKIQEHRRRLVDTEARRQVAEQTAITFERAASMLLLVLDVIFRRIVDQEIRLLIFDDLKRLQLLPGVNLPEPSKAETE